MPAHRISAAPGRKARALLAALVLLGCGGGNGSSPAGDNGSTTRRATSAPAGGSAAAGVTSGDARTGGEAPALPLAADRMSVLAALRARRFADLDRLLGALARAAAEDPAGRELVADNAFAAFNIADPSLEALLDEWLEKMPGAPTGLAARALYRNSRAWEARGGRWTRETPDAAFAEMARWLESAAADAQAAVDQRPELASAWRVLLNAHHGDRRRLGAVARDALDALPASFPIRSTILHFLLPRWGGSYEAMEEVIADAQPLQSRNANLRRLRNRIAIDRADMAIGEGDVAAAERWLAAGLAAGGPDWELFQERADLRRKQKRMSEALADVDRALELWPDEPKLVADRLRLLFALGRDADAPAGIARLAALDPTNKELARSRRRLAGTDAEACRTLSAGDAPQAALPRCDAALALAPADEDVLYWKGRALLELDRYDEAESAFAAALAAQPRSRRAIENLDYLLARRREWDRIVALWDRYLELEPGDAKALLERAGTHRHRGDRAASCRDLERSCALGGEAACPLVKRYCPRSP